MAYDATTVYLDLTNGPSSDDTQSSLMTIAHGLQNGFVAQTVRLTGDLENQCTLFDRNNLCAATVGRYSADGNSNASGMVIIGYRISDHSRIGAFVDENVTNADSYGVTYKNASPLVGAYWNWLEKQDETGLSTYVSGAYGTKDSSITRMVIGTSEPGTGNSALFSFGAEAEIRFGKFVTSSIMVQPYAGLRYTQLRSMGYSEATSASVGSPLNYADLVQEMTTALVGVHISDRLDQHISAYSSFGVEQDLSLRGGELSPSGLSDLSSIDFTPGAKTRRPSAMAGISYDIAANQRIQLDGMVKESIFTNTNSQIAMMKYQMGF